LRCEQEMCAVWLPNKAQAIKADMVVELDINEGDAIFRTALPGRVAV